jgi:hypothetical protein
MPFRVGVIRLLSVGLLVVVTTGCAYLVSLMPPPIRPPAVVLAAYFGLSLAWFGTAGRLIRLLALDIPWIGSAISSSAGIGILAMGVVTFHPGIREGWLIGQLATIAFIGCFATGYGFLATLPVNLIRFFFGSKVGAKVRMVPVDCVVLGFITGVVSLLTLISIEFTLWRASGSRIYQTGLEIQYAVFAVAGYFGARGEWLAYTVRRSSHAVRADVPPPPPVVAPAVAEAVAVSTAGVA